MRNAENMCRDPEYLEFRKKRHNENRAVHKARAARDVTPGTSWAFTAHRNMAEVAAKLKARPKTPVNPAVPNASPFWQLPDEDFDDFLREHGE